MDAMLENKPMTLQDEPNERDFCGIEQYYTGLSNFIKQCQPPLTISIQGDWGTGKTSMMHRIAMNLEEEGYAAIWFDSWRFVQFGEADQLPAILINQLASEMVKLSEKASSRENETGSDTGSDAPQQKDEKNDEKKEERKEKIKKFKRLTSILIHSIAENSIKNLPVLIPGAIPVKEYVTKVAEGVTNETAENVKKFYDKKEAEFDKKDESVSDIISRLQKSFSETVGETLTLCRSERMVIFIDDLDRLPPARAVEVLEVIKNFLTCEKCIFVLAIDFSVIAAGVKTKYGADMSEAKCRSFFEKIIQVPFTLPTAKYNIDSYIKSCFESMNLADISDETISVFSDLIKSSVGANPRMIKRVLNTFLLYGNIYSDKEWKNDTKLFSLLCMQARYEDAYKYIVKKCESSDKSYLQSILQAARSDDESMPAVLEDFDKMFDDTDELQGFISFLTVLQKTFSGDKIKDAEYVEWKKLLVNTSISVSKAGGTSTRDNKSEFWTLIKEEMTSRGITSNNIFTLNTPGVNILAAKASDRCGTYEMRTQKSSVGVKYFISTSKKNAEKLADYIRKKDIYTQELSNRVHGKVEDKLGDKNFPGLEIMNDKINPKSSKEEIAAWLCMALEGMHSVITE